LADTTKIIDGNKLKQKNAPLGIAIEALAFILSVNKKFHLSRVFKVRIAFKISPIDP
jgi:hypothetical protein